MKLSQLFTGGPQVEESGRVNQKQTARTADVNSQIRSLVPGQTIRGEIVSRNGGEVQIRVSEDMVLNARVDQSIYLEQGKNVTFEVKNNGRALSLSPLFSNVATDANVLKAAMKMCLNHRKQKAQRTHGKISVKKLIGEGVGGHRLSKSRTVTSSLLSVWQKSTMLILP